MAYTPPKYNAVYFDSQSGYTPPKYNAVHFLVDPGPEPEDTTRYDIFYECVITGGESYDDIIVPISSFQARKRSSTQTFLTVVVPNTTYAEDIADRINGGEIFVYIVYKHIGVEHSRAEMVSSSLDTIRIDEGPFSKSITLTGYKTQSYDPKSVSATGSTYYSVNDGNITFRLARPNPYINPGDTVTIDGVECSPDTISYYYKAIKGGINQTMELRETAGTI